MIVTTSRGLRTIAFAAAATVALAACGSTGPSLSPPPAATLAATPVAARSTASVTTTATNVQTAKLPAYGMDGPIAVSGDRAVVSVSLVGQDGLTDEPTMFVVDLKSKAVKQYPGGGLGAQIAGSHVVWLEGSCEGSLPGSPDDPWCSGSFQWMVKVLDLDTGQTTTALAATNSRLGYWDLGSTPAPMRPELGLMPDGFVTAIEDPADAKGWTIEALDFEGHVRWALSGRRPVMNLTAADSVVVWEELAPSPAGRKDKDEWAGSDRHDYALFGQPGLPIDLGRPNGAVAGPGYALVSEVRPSHGSALDEVIVTANQTPLVMCGHLGTDKPAVSERYVVWPSDNPANGDALQIYDVKSGAASLVRVGGQPFHFGASDSWLVWMTGSNIDALQWVPMSSVAPPSA